MTQSMMSLRWNSCMIKLDFMVWIIWDVECCTIDIASNLEVWWSNTKYMFGKFLWRLGRIHAEWGGVCLYQVSNCLMCCSCALLWESQQVESWATSAVAGVFATQYEEDVLRCAPLLFINAFKHPLFLISSLLESSALAAIAWLWNVIVSWILVSMHRLLRVCCRILWQKNIPLSVFNVLQLMLYESWRMQRSWSQFRRVVPPFEK